MANLWLSVRMNYPIHIFDLVLLAVAAWLLASPRRQSRATIWAAFALIGQPLIRMVFLLQVAGGASVSPVFRLVGAAVWAGSLGLLFAAVLVDRRWEHADR